MVKVTVILPLYNNKEDVLTAIQSVVDQTYSDWELIVVDDCSTDGSYDVVKEFITNNSYPIRLIKTDKNSGPFVAMNEGLLIADGEYITRLDSDDTFDERKLDFQVGVLDNNPDKLVSKCNYQREEGMPVEGEVTIMYRKSVIDQIGYYDSVRFGADTEFLNRIRMHFGSMSIRYDQELLYYAKIRPSSLTQSKVSGDMSIRMWYHGQYCGWHSKAEDGGTLYLPYPITEKERPFTIDPLMLP